MALDAPTSDPGYARGNVAYGSGTSAPTRGTVDPTGYVQRSLDNPSQSRSGLAAAAMQRRLNPAPDAHQLHMEHLAHLERTGQTITPTPHPRGTGQFYAPTASKVAPVASAPKIPGPGLTHVHRTPDGSPVASGPVGTPAVGPVTTNATMANLPNDPKIQAMLNALERQKLEFEGQHETGLQNQLSNLAKEKELLQQQEPIQEARNQAHFASRGMGFSSGMVDQLANIKNAMERRLGNYDQQETLDKNNYQMALQQFLDNYLAKQQNALGAQAAWDVPNLANSVLAQVLRNQ